jgi:uncharacterized protein (DUF4415 family)
MTRKYGKPDRENPEWTADEMRAARPAHEVFPEAFVGVAVPPKRRRGERGPQKAATKQQITLRLSRHVVTAYRETGRGWQARMDADLERAARRLKGRRSTHA